MCYIDVGYRWTEYPESTAWTLLIRHNTGLSEWAKRQHLTHAAGKLLLTSGAATMTFINLPLRKLQRKINSRKILGLFLFHPDILFCLSQHADAVKQVTKILGFRGLCTTCPHHFQGGRAMCCHLHHTLSVTAHWPYLKLSKWKKNPTFLVAFHLHELYSSY